MKTITAAMQTAAYVVLTTDAHLRRVNRREPPSNDDGMPIDEGRWGRWYDDEFEPATDARKRAVAKLAHVLGEPSLPTHTLTLRKICRDVVDGSWREDAIIRDEHGKIIGRGRG